MAITGPTEGIVSRRGPSSLALFSLRSALSSSVTRALSLVPENDSTGGKVKQKGLSKKGDRYLRSLLVNGAMAVVHDRQ
jgi:transposase